ncbi:MAG: VOC family protein [Myxococcota bacterium]
MSAPYFSHIGVCVRDCAASLRFYCEGLGFREVGALEVEGAPSDTLLELEGVKLRAVYLERDGQRLELLDFRAPGSVGAGEPREMNRRGLTHLSFRVSDADAVALKLAELGGRILEATRTRAPDFDAVALFVLDPDGTRIELVQQPGDPRALPGGAG